MTSGYQAWSNFNRYTWSKFSRYGQTYKEDLNEWMFDGLMNYVFFRYTNPELPASVEEVVKLATEHCYWPPEYIWYKGVMHDCPDGSELADGRIIHRFE
jgi:hypothetical protein